MWALIGLFALAIAWSLIGEVDIVAIAPGRIVVSDRTKIVQPLESAVVRAVLVKDGERVKAGQVLIELDSTTAAADRRSVDQQRDATEADVRRAEVLLKALDHGKPLVEVNGDHQLGAEWADMRARLSKFDAELARRRAESETIRQGIRKVQATLPLAVQRETDIQSLVQQGYISGHAGQDRTRERIELERDLTTQTSRLGEAEAALFESSTAKVSYVAELRKSLAERVTKGRVALSQLSEQRIKTSRLEELTHLRSPVDGVVQQLAVHSVGGVVTPAQTLLVVVPDAAAVIAEVAIENKDIGFVRAGLNGELKLEAFPFTKYGTVQATVMSVAADAVISQDRPPYFPATLRLDRALVEVNGRSVPLQPGLVVTAEVKTGRRRLIEFLLAPMQAAVTESGHER